MKRLTLSERMTIDVLLKEDFSFTDIAKRLGRSVSSISREVKRNGTHNGYHAEIANKKAIQRRKSIRRPRKVDDPKLREVIENGLREYLSPEQISGRLKLMAKDDPTVKTISFSTIYTYIELGLLNLGGRDEAKKCLRNQGKKRRKPNHVETRGRYTIDHTIHDRSEEANNRTRFLDVEIDLVLGSSPVCLLTIVCRKTRYAILGLLRNKTAAVTNRALIDALKDLPVKSITCDRGKEFAKYAEVEKALGVTFHFADPRSPWQKGTNENTNGLLRQYFPKGCPIPFDEEAVQAAQDSINNRPRKMHDYRTCAEMFLKAWNEETNNSNREPNPSEPGGSADDQAGPSSKASSRKNHTPPIANQAAARPPERKIRRSHKDDLG